MLVMSTRNLGKLLDSLLALGRECQWVEYKRNNQKPDDIGEYISALSNSAYVTEQTQVLRKGQDCEQRQIPQMFQMGDQTTVVFSNEKQVLVKQTIACFP